MKTLLFVAIISLGCSHVTAHSEIVEIALADLAGPYSEGIAVSRSAAFELGRRPVEVYAAWVKLTIDVNARWYMCAFHNFDEYLRGVDIDAEMPDRPRQGHWNVFQRTPNEGGRFEVLVQFKPVLGATWEFLSDKAGEITLFVTAYPIVDSCFPLAEYSDAIVEEASVIIDAEFPVPIEVGTWGAVKALYRH